MYSKALWLITRLISNYWQEVCVMMLLEVYPTQGRLVLALQATPLNVGYKKISDKLSGVFSTLSNWKAL